MKATLDQTEGLVRKLKIEVPAPTVQTAFEKVYRGIQRQATIKGFRKGKAPLTAIRSVYGERVRQDVLNDLISSSYSQALNELNLDPVGYPHIQVQNFNEGDHFTYSAQFEIRPPVDLKKVEGLKIEREKVDISEQQVLDVLENIRQGQAELVPVVEDRAAIMGDWVQATFEGFIDGVPVPNSKAEGRHLELGKANFIDGFEEGMLGMRPGEERDLNLKFPDEYHSKDIEGRPVVFKVRLDAIKKRVVPELTDELAKKVGSFQSLDELKASIRKDLTEREEKRVRDEVRNAILRSLVDANPIEAPISLVRKQKQVLMEDVRSRLAQQGQSEEQIKEYAQKWDQDLTETATFIVKSTFLIDAVAEKFGLKAQASDLEAKIDEFARQTGIEHARVSEFYQDGDRRSRLSFQITEERVVNYLLEKAEIKEVTPRKDGQPRD